MMRQYLEIKDRCKDAILFFRLGDFYEMFFEDAIEASKILEITLTTRNKNDANPVPLCGIPYHAASSYISKLIEHDKKVAICEQVEDPKLAKGIVKRDIVRVITPGLVVDEGNLKSKDSNYLVALSRIDKLWGLAFIDLSTGDYRVTEMESEGAGISDVLMDELLRINPRELVLPESFRETIQERDLLSLIGCPVTCMEDVFFEPDDGTKTVLTHFNLQSLDGLGCAQMSSGVGAAGAILSYIKETQGDNLSHIDRLKPYSSSSFMLIDFATKRNLELTSTIYDDNRKGSLFQILDFTQTAMGGRKLKEWINYPLQDIEKIKGRLNAIEELKRLPAIRRDLKEALGGVYDLERLNGRVSLGRANPRDMISLRNSLRKLPNIVESLNELSDPLIKEMRETIDTIPEMELLISSAIEDEPPINLKDGGIICKGYNADLDELREISREGKGYLAKLETAEKKRTGISSLKVRYNKVFGYYIEVTKTNLDLVPEDYIRKQTLSNAERFITPELKEYEAKILGADEKITTMEYDLFVDVRAQAAGFSGRLRDTAEALSILDAVLSLTEVAERNNYSMPIVNDSKTISIKEGRHPVVEKLNPDEPFVPNDTELSCEKNQIGMITGPNMAGKSTYIRQVALITLMAHMGSFVPAESATIGLVDKIYTRVGASDNLAKGQSTFMVEMTETANILNNATERSLIVLDEIGRGTSTFDGVSIAWAVAEFIHDHEELGARTLFATHYHELTELCLTKNRVKNFNVAVKEWNNSIIFLRKIVEGGASRSYGIEVARLAGLPSTVIDRSLEILNNLESGELDDVGMPMLALPKKRKVKEDEDNSRQMSLFMHPAEHLFEEIRSLDISSMTPLDALNRLSRLKEEVK
ncbi:MAG: DNA mismatch repair protein MutS [Proteobacteria bacterium]|nr:DNA mismatch repair protein MutS [Pseudomonadota bacterium]